MIATIADRLADDCDVCLAKPFAQISAQLSSPDSGRIPVNVVLSIDFPLPIKHGVAWQLFRNRRNLSSCVVDDIRSG